MATVSDGPNLLSLPDEIINLILKNKNLADVHICRVAQVCRKLHDVCFSNEIWRAKIRQRWPSLFSKSAEECQSIENWLDLYKICFSLSCQVRYLLQSLSESYHHKEDISSDGYHCFFKLLERHKLAPKFVFEELHQILFYTDRYKNLTDKYYAEKVWHHLQHMFLKEVLIQFLKKPPEEQFLEVGGMLVSRWFQPGLGVTDEALNRQLDEISEKVRTELRERTGSMHPVCDKTYTLITGGLAKDMWTPEQCGQVLEAINTVLYQHLGFCPNESSYYTPFNSYLDKVLELKTGIPITLCILYSTIARRLGVVCEPVNFPSHFLLRWKEHPMATPTHQYTYIDAYNKGRFMTRQSCQELLNLDAQELDLEAFECTTPTKVLERMAGNMVRIARQLNHSTDGLQILCNAVDLYLIISPEDIEMRLLQVRIFLHRNINLCDAVESLQQVAAVDMSRIGLVGYLTKEVYTLMRENEQKESAGYKKPPKLRADNPEVDFSVGMVMKHKRYHYTCVIYGWDKECRASEEWITQMGVQNLPGKQFQPFYNVLVDDGSNRYAAQENLMYTTDIQPITHPEVGRYFKEFTGHFYIPNKPKQEEYPEDEAVTHNLMQRYFSNHVSKEPPP